MRLSWDQVLAWRCERQLLDRRHQVGTVEVVRRLCGVQAQVASCAEQAVIARLKVPAASPLSGPVRNRELVRTWAMRGTLHLLAVDDAGAYLSLLAGRRREGPAQTQWHVPLGSDLARRRAAPRIAR